ncbi:MAG: hypothetical protein ACUVSP_08320, partial [Desulfotomaculales bacterium]
LLLQLPLGHGGQCFRIGGSGNKGFQHGPAGFAVWVTRHSMLTGHSFIRGGLTNFAGTGVRRAKNKS